MSSKYYFIKDYKPKPPFLKLKEKIEFERWESVINSYKNTTWDIDTKHGLFYFERYGASHFKSQVYFNYTENPNEFIYVPGESIKTGTYAFFIVLAKEYGYAYAQFSGKEKKEFIPLLYEISQRLGCYLLKDGKHLITEVEINNLKKTL